MAGAESNPTTERVARRTRIVWATFVGAMTLVTGLLLLDDGAMRSANGAPLFNPISLADENSGQTLFRTAAPLDRDRWRGIVIHHSGGPAGDVDSLHNRHTQEGRGGLGYHFVIGNGTGMEDGLIGVGYRWNQQEPGRHSIGDQRTWLNEHTIGICLIGNGQTRPFSDRQIRRLVQLVQELQREFGIPANRVLLHRDRAEVVSPGRFFPEAMFQGQLLSLPR